MYEYKVPEFFKYIKWYNLDDPLDLYNFVQEMIIDGIDLNDYPEIKTYYDIMYNSAMDENADMVVADYAMNKLKHALMRYGFAHTSRYVRWDLFYYWYDKER